MLLIKLAVRNLSRRRARSILTIIGVGIAIAFTVTILSMSEGLMVSFENSIAKQGADVVIVPKEAEAYPYPDVAAFVGSFPEELLDEIEQVDNVGATFPVFTAIPMDFMPEKPGAMPLLYGVTPEYFPEVVPYLGLAEGRYIEDGDEFTIVAGSGIAEVTGACIIKAPAPKRPPSILIPPSSGQSERTGGVMGRASLERAVPESS